LKFHIFELKIVVNEIQHCGVICCIEHRPAKLDLDSSFKFVCRQLIGEINQDITVDPFSIAEDMICPDRIIHEFKKIALHTLKNLAV
jgi:hypothetical protein